MKIIVTGGAGFIGSALVRYLVLEQGAEVVVIDKMTYAANRANIAPAEATGRCRLIVEDICNQAAMTEIIAREAPQQILHLAAESHVDRSISGPRDFVETNVIGTYSMLRRRPRLLGGSPAPGRRKNALQIPPWCPTEDGLWAPMGPRRALFRRRRAAASHAGSPPLLPALRKGRRREPSSPKKGAVGFPQTVNAATSPRRGCVFSQNRDAPRAHI